MPWSRYRINSLSFGLPGLRGCRRGCGNGEVSDEGATDEAGGVGIAPKPGFVTVAIVVVKVEYISRTRSESGKGAQLASYLVDEIKSATLGHLIVQVLRLRRWMALTDEVG